MPSKLSFRGSSQLYYKRRRVAALAPQDVQVGGKWRGWEPDLRGLTASWEGFHTVSHLLPSATGLQTDDGYVWVDKNDPASVSLPLGTGTLPSANPQPVVGLVEWAASTAPSDPPFLIAVTAKTAAGDGRYFYRPSATADWTPIAQGAAEVVTPITLCETTGAILYDTEVYYPGATARNPGTLGPSLTTPIVITCNGYEVVGAGTEPASPVMAIYGNPPEYGILTEELSAGGTAYFAARTCTEFQDRMVFGATQEDGAAYPLRVRWSAIHDASLITTATPGAGALDLYELHTPIQRILPLGDLLAIYTGDGVAFLTRTLRATDPFQRRYITTTRGLLGPRALCAIGRDLHFGIFTDGWYTLGQSGEWNRVGLDETNGTRWDREFYRQLVYAQRDQTTVGYDAYRQVVRISFVAGVDQNVPNVVWNLDLRTNTLWPSQTGAALPTYWSTALQVYETSSLTWATVAGDWATITGTWQDYLTHVEDIPAPVFGTNGGMVYQLSYASVLQGFRLTNATDTPIDRGVPPAWSAESHRVPAAQVGQFSCPTKLWLNYLDQGPTTVQMGFSDTDGTQSTQSVSIGGISADSAQSAYSSHRASFRQLAWTVSGAGAARLQGVRVQLLPSSVEQIRPPTT